MLDKFEQINDEVNKFLSIDTDINLVASFIAFMYTIHTKYNLQLDYNRYYNDFKFEKRFNHYRTIENDMTIITAILIEEAKYKFIITFDEPKVGSSIENHISDQRYTD